MIQIYTLEIIDKVKYLENAMNGAAYNLASCVAEGKPLEDIKIWTEEFQKNQKRYHDFLNKKFK